MSELGYCNPPISTRFPKGQSGNPKGRPKGRHNEPPYEAVFGQTVTIKEDGCRPAGRREPEDARRGAAGESR